MGKYFNGKKEVFVKITFNWELSDDIIQKILFGLPGTFVQSADIVDVNTLVSEARKQGVTQGIIEMRDELLEGLRNGDVKGDLK